MAQGSVAAVKAFLPGPADRADDVENGDLRTLRDETSHNHGAPDAIKQGSVDAAKLKPPRPPLPKPATLDVDALLGKIRLKLPLPTPRPREDPTWLERRRERPGSVHAWARLWQHADCEYDGHCKNGAAGWRGTIEPLSSECISARVPRQSAVELGKASVCPSRVKAVELVPQSRGLLTNATKDTVDVWADKRPTRRHGCWSLSCLGLRSIFRLISQPPLATLKLMTVFPGVLLLGWFGVVRSLPLGPLGSYAALSLAMLTLMAQAYAVALPLTGSIALLAIQLPDLIDGAFAELDDSLSASLRHSVALLGLPVAIEDRVVAILLQPPSLAIRVVRNFLPDFGRLFPESFTRGSTLAPVMFLLLLTALAVLQVASRRESAGMARPRAHAMHARLSVACRVWRHRSYR